MLTCVTFLAHQFTSFVTSTTFETISVVIWLKNCEAEEAPNRDTIWVACHDLAGRGHGAFWRQIVTRFEQSWHNFWHAWQVFMIRLVIPWVVRINRDTILAIVTWFWVLTVLGHYLSVSVHFLREFQERKTWEIKGGKFRVEGLWLGFSWGGKHCKHLGWVKIIECLVHWWDWENGLGLFFVSLLKLISCNSFVSLVRTHW